MRILIAAVVLLAGCALGQGGFEPSTSNPPHIIVTVANGARVYTHGYWASLEKNNNLNGPSVSEIVCYKPEMSCHEEQANIVAMGDWFSLLADSADYRVTRWTDKEIVASHIVGICRVLSVLKFDLVNKRVYAYQTLSEPVDQNLPKLSKDICSAGGLSLELKDSTLFRVNTKRREN